MNTLLYFFVIAASMMGLTQLLPGFHVRSWAAALIAAVVLALVNAIVKPILFVLTLPFTIVTLGLFLLVLNALMLALTDAIMGESLEIRGFTTTLVASIVLSLVGMIWKGLTKKDD